MSDPDGPPRENLFKIIDGIINQLNLTKRLFIFMIVTVMILPPMAFFVSFVLFEPQFGMYDGERMHGGFRLFHISTLPLIISLIWLGIGIWQWFVLSKWTKKYDRYKKLQDRVDKKLDEGPDDKEGGTT